MATKYKIEELDLSSRRSIDVDSFGDQEAVVRYFYHAGQFWLARVPLDGVESIYGQAFNFSTPKRRRTETGTEVIKDARGVPIPRFGFINHVQCRFRLAKGKSIKLFPMDGDIHDTPSAEIDDFVYSIEAVGPPGISFGFRNGMAGNLMCAHRFLSTQEMVFERVAVLGYYIRESPPLPLSTGEMRDLLVKSIRRSDQAGLDETYYLYRCCGTNNCTSNPFTILDSVLQYTGWQKIGAVLYRLPLNPRLYLRVRGLDSNPREYRLVRGEFMDFLNLPETRRRKREVVRAEIRKRREAKQG